MSRNFTDSPFGRVRLAIFVLLLIVANNPAARSADADAIATTGDTRTDSLGDPLPEGARLRLGTLRFRHPSSVAELALSPDEKTVVTLNRRHLVVWDTVTGKEQWRTNADEHHIHVPAASYGIRALAFASDSSRFYTTDGRNQIVVWTVDSGRTEIVTIQGQKQLGFGPLGRFSGTKAIDVTRDGRSFVVGGAQGAVVCDRRGEVLFEIENTAEAPARNRDRLTRGCGKSGLSRTQSVSEEAPRPSGVQGADGETSRVASGSD